MDTTASARVWSNITSLAVHCYVSGRRERKKGDIRILGVLYIYKHVQYEFGLVLFAQIA
jgi:hypothetical protein